MPKPSVTADEAFLLHRALMEVPRSGWYRARRGGRRTVFHQHRVGHAYQHEPAAALGVLEHTGLGRVECVAQHERRMHPVLAHARKVRADGPVAGGSSILRFPKWRRATPG